VGGVEEEGGFFGDDGGGDLEGELVVGEEPVVADFLGAGFSGGVSPIFGENFWRVAGDEGGGNLHFDKVEFLFSAHGGGEVDEEFEGAEGAGGAEIDHAASRGIPTATVEAGSFATEGSR